MNILLADDDNNFGAVLKRELEEERYTVDHVTNGVDAVLHFIGKPYSFVLLDLRMPRLDGNDTLRIIKKLNPHVPVISFSGHAGPGQRAESVECGALKCLPKPFAVSELKDEIRGYIRQSPGTRDPGFPAAGTGHPLFPRE